MIETIGSDGAATALPNANMWPVPILCGQAKNAHPMAGVLCRENGAHCRTWMTAAIFGRRMLRRVFIAARWLAGGVLSPRTFSAAPLSKALHFVKTGYYKKTQLAREISGQLYFMSLSKQPPRPLRFKQPVQIRDAFGYELLISAGSFHKASDLFLFKKTLILSIQLF